MPTTLAMWQTSSMLASTDLPRLDAIIQADFIGFGGSDEYTPNTITYKFPDVPLLRRSFLARSHRLTLQRMICVMLLLNR
jgi:hypothetical protein